MDKIKLFIFDMDGLMFETGRLVYRAYLESAKEFDYEMVHGVYYYLAGRTESKILEGMRALYGQDQDVVAWRRAVNKYKEIVLQEEKRVYKKKGLVEILKFTKENGVLTAIASSSPRALVQHYLTIEGVLEYFNYIVAGDEVTKGKPDSEIFLTACKKAGTAPNEALVFEDSIVGITASRLAGIRSCLIEDDITDMAIRSGRHKLLNGVEDFPITKDDPTYTFQDLTEAKDFLCKSRLLLPD